MTTTKKNISSLKESIPSAKGFRFGIVVAEWNKNITDKLYEGARKILVQQGTDEKDIITRFVPGSFEIPLAAKKLIEKENADAVICLGCILKGETIHNEVLAYAVANGLMRVQLETGKPVVFGILTPSTMKQALERAGGKLGNKGEEAAITALKMLG